MMAGFALLTDCTTAPLGGIHVVTGFDLPRYEGRWYEIARLDYAFERNLSDVTATYTAQPDGSVRVVNRGYDTRSGQWREAVGKAVATGTPGTGSLKVSFFGPFYAGYHVVALDPDYRWALVVGINLHYAWILARDKQIPTAQRDAILERAGQLGVDTSALVWVTQGRHDPAQ